MQMKHSDIPGDEALKGRLRNYCLRHAPDPDTGEDVYLNTLWHIWSGYPSLRNKETPAVFEAWAWTICRRALQNANKRDRHRQEWELPIDEHMAQIEDPNRATLEQNIQRRQQFEAIRSAYEQGYLTDPLYRALYTRRKYADKDLAEVAEQLQMRINTLVVNFLRAVQALQVFLILERPDWFGGHEEIQEAYDLACSKGELTPDEKEAFTRYALRGDRRGAYKNSAILRSVCGKVRQYLPDPF